MNIVWINGWGLGTGYPSRIAADMYSEYSHSFIQPKDDWASALEGQPMSSTVVAFSIGAFLLLGRPDLGKRFRRVVYVAPFEDFKSESGRGGRVRLGQLRYLRRWLERDWTAAVKDFAERAGLALEESSAEGLRKEDCLWGVDRLISDSVEVGALKGREAIIGEADPLLDAGRLKETHPGLEVVPRVGHDLGELLKGAEVKL